MKELSENGDKFFVSYYGTEEDTMFKQVFTQIANIEIELPMYLNTNEACAEEMGAKWGSMNIHKYKGIKEFEGKVDRVEGLNWLNVNRWAYINRFSE
jgi:hypothetical protein